MILFEDALKKVLSQNILLDVERISLSQSPGRILSEDIFSDMEMPPFDKSAVDGYACKYNEFNTSAERSQIDVILEVVEILPAGVVPLKTVFPGQCSKIMTGAMVPSGADCIIMVEDTDSVGENLVRIKGKNNMNNICQRGEDIKEGARVLQKGVQIGPAHVAVLAGVGAVNPLVARLPKVGIISTGDELVEPSVKPGMAQIRNSNASQLEAQIKSVPANSKYYGISADEGPEMRKIIDRALNENDVVLITGGVSMGDFDFVPAVMMEAGVHILFKSVAIQPGKPTVFGRRGDAFIFGLPGNPVSSFVLFEMMVKPFLWQIMGSIKESIQLKIPMGVDFSRRKSMRKSMIPVVIKDGVVVPVEYHGSAHINAYTIANGILTMEIGMTSVKKGELVDVRLL